MREVSERQKRREKMIKYEPRYVEDFYSMTDMEREKMRVRCGKIDTGAVFEAIFGEVKFASLKILGATKIDFILTELTRMRDKGNDQRDCELHSCQLDMLRLEFGKDECSAADLVSMNDYYYNTPRARMMRKLQETLELIAKTSVVWPEYWEQCDAEVNFGELNYVALAERITGNKAASDWVTPVQTVIKCSPMRFWSQLQPWEQDLLRLEFGTERMPLRQVATITDGNLLQTSITVLQVTLDRLLDKLFLACRSVQ